jgi:hypothetical protein
MNIKYGNRFVRNVGNYLPKDTASHLSKPEPSETVNIMWQWQRRIQQQAWKHWMELYEIAQGAKCLV